jgi:hypothetical protein
LCHNPKIRPRHPEQQRRICFFFGNLFESASSSETKTAKSRFFVAEFTLSKVEGLLRMTLRHSLSKEGSKRSVHASLSGAVVPVGDAWVVLLFTRQA